MDRSDDIQLRVDGRGRARGFTLIELMVVAAIVAILMAIAVPSYAIFMKQSRRGSAESILMDIAQREQQYLNDARAYAPDTTPVNGVFVTLSTTVPANVTSYYNVQICQTTAGACKPPGGAPPTFAVIATPIAGTAQAGDPVLTIDNTGAKTPANVW
jgi:type IV pilus assembly protein PilE